MSDTTHYYGDGHEVHKADPNITFALTVDQLSKEFDERCQERHDMGAEKYGPVNFLKVDSMEMMIEEILDMANYARYNYIKARLIQEHLEGVVAQNTKFMSNKERKL